MRGLRLLLVAVLLAALGGCVQVDETIELVSDGTGTYSLTVRWDADLLQRTTSLLGRRVVERLAGRAFPLDVEAWRDGLRGLPGVKIVSLEARDAGGGRREIALVAAFDHLDSILAWEVAGRRDLSVRLFDPRSGLQRAEGRAEEGDTALLEMTPFTRLPVLDPLARAWRARTAPEDPALDARERDPARSLGLEGRDADLVATILAPRLAEISLVSRLKVPGTFISVDAKGSEPPEDAGTARLRLTFQDLLDGADRRFRARWQPLLLDVVPTFDHTGDATPLGR